MNIAGKILPSLIALSGVCAMTRELLLNGSLQVQDGETFPPYWIMLNSGGSRTDYFPTGGPGGRPFVRISSPDRTVHFQQNNLKLLPGEKYIVSASFRTQNVHNKESGICVGASSYPNKREHLTNTLFGLPANQPDWRRYEKVITLPGESDPIYPYFVLDVILGKGGGVLDVAELSLKPATEKAEKGSLSQMDNVEPHLIPLGDLFHIPADRPQMEFSWAGPLPAPPEGLECEFFFARENRIFRAPFRVRRFAVEFSGLSSLEEQTMRIRLLARADGRQLYEETHPVRLVRIPAMPPAARRLNNLVTELHNGRFAPGNSLVIPNNRQGFLLFRFLPDTKGAAFTVTLNGTPLFQQDAPQSETIRDLEPGEYMLALQGGTAGTLIVRQIPDVMTFSLWGPRLPGNGPYTWEYGKKHWLPGLTTLNIGPNGEKEFAECVKMGRLYLDNYGIQNWSKPNDPGEMLERMNTDKVMSSPRNHGTTLDENECCYPTMLDPFAYAIRHFPNPHDKLLVTYQTGPVSPALLNSLSAAANASRGRAWLAFEQYPRGQRNEEELQNMLDMVRLEWRIFRTAAPGLFYKSGVIWGNFSCPPAISIAHCPSVDFKVVLDREMHLLATAGEFDGLRKLGFWGTYAADEEIARWSFRLTRHYAFEGHTEMLSGRYGYRLNPGHLQNGDFTQGLSHWNASGNICADSYPDYGYNTLMLHGAEGAGDAFALFRKEPGATASLSQQAKNLIPGKKYLLYAFVGDLDDVIQKRQRPRPLPLNIRITDSTIHRHVHYTGNRSQSRAGNAWMNVHQFIFTPDKDTITISFDNAQAEDGQQLMLNFVCLRPYYDVEENWY